MRLSFGQQMQMAQKQVLAPRMIQSMEILQLPIVALQERIEQEMEDNPVLDQAEPTGEEPFSGEEVVNADAPSEAERELVVKDDTNNEEDFERLLNMADNMPADYEERSRPSRGQIEAEGDRRHDAMANMVSRPESLLDYLQHQLSWYDLSDELRRMCERIIYNLDSNGYLKSPLEELASPPPDQNGDTKDWQVQQLELATEALSIVQRLDPPGVGGRTLKECLLLQLTPGLLFYEELQVLIENHLEDLENNRLPKISKKTGFSIETINESWEDLRTLEPKPGSKFNDNFAPSVTPDIFVERLEASGYKVRLEDGELPTLYISPNHRRMLQQAMSSGDKKTCEYIKKKINAAQWLIEAIEQRRSTLTRVSQAIVDHQIKFLDEGPEHIEPLKMQQVADRVGVHVTTVSRAVDDKWMATPRGIFPLKRFFVGGTTSADGEEVAWDKVRLKLQEIVDEEDKAKPLSDDALVEELAKSGITVARRTVTKYRKAMNIPSSRQRRDWTEAKK
ncbi:MAG: RNA polymerase factor sigma-54 [Pirellulales bacterium]|nr:RNA polymerase factor sigma-54 [Pirellulales bacterium]